MMMTTRIVAFNLSRRGRGLVTAADVQLGPKWNSLVGQYSASSLRQLDRTARDDLAYCLQFAQDENDFAQNFHQIFPTPQMKKEQLRIAQQQLMPKHGKRTKPKLMYDIKDHEEGRLPCTLQDALRPTSRAIVITESQAPYRVFDVNPAWEELCEYTYLESRGKTLGSLLRGPRTNTLAATGLITSLLRGEPEAGTILTNYTKSGRAFQNRIRVGPIYNAADSQKVTHFVGILEEVKM